MALDVFISYSSKDKPIADSICASLEAAGIRCWIAPRDIAAGEEWPKAITNAIAKSQVMVLVFSSNSNASSDVGREIVLAANKNLIIIPFKIENVEPEPGKQYYLAQTHWLEAMNPPTREQIKALVERVKMIIPPLATEAVASPVSALPPEKEQPAATTPTVKKNWLRREYLWIGAALLLIVLAVSLWPRLQGMVASPAATPTVTATAPTPAATDSIESTSVELPTSTATRIVPTSTPRPIWNRLETLTGHKNEVNSVAFSPDGNLLASSSRDNTVIIWDTASWQPMKTLAVYTSQVTSVVFSPDGKTLATGSGMGILLWDTATWTVRQTLKDHTGAVRVLAYSSDGRRLASGSDDKTIILWDTTNYSKYLTLYDHTWMVMSLGFSPDGRFLASSGYQDSSIMVNDTESGKRLQTLAGSGSSGDIWSVDFSPDGQTLAIGSENGLITLWDSTSWKKVQTFASANYVAFSPDGHTLAGGHWNGKVTLWNTSTWNSTQILAGHTGEITSLAFSADGRLLASGSMDDTVRIWKLDNP